MGVWGEGGIKRDGWIEVGWDWVVYKMIRERMCFFFQAEDGIRDIGVTGVQTCALPISEVNY